MVMPPGEVQRVGVPRALSRRERWMIRGVLGVVAILAVALAVAIASTGKNSAHGCIYATIPGPVGAQEINQCGSAARATCQSVTAPGAYTAQGAQVIERECRKAGLATG